MGGVMGSTMIRTRLYIHLRGRPKPMSLNAYGIRALSIRTPSRHLHRDLASLFKDLHLADPEFADPQGIDLVLGADVYHRIMLRGLIRRDSYIAQQTAFGWTITGAIDGHEPGSSAAVHLASTCSPAITWHEALIGTLQRFWATEEIPRVVRRSTCDAACEDLYARKHWRDQSGRYVVPLPVIQKNLPLLGESLTNARDCLRSLHGRMSRDPSMKEEYGRFMREYLALGHMRPLTPQELSDQSTLANYLPHHGIWQRRDGGKKLRVVFNASCPTTSGRSLNDVLHPGPKLQIDLITVITRWRRWAVAFCADIRMMFRQIRVHDADVNLQRIVWSPSACEPEGHFVLCTVTYGETCAPYLALRTLKQLSMDEGAGLPEARRAIENELYVDDFLCGADSEEGAIARRDQLVQLLRAGGFSLKKWVSNRPGVLEEIPPEDRLRPSWLQFSSDGPVNELGILWDPVNDCMKFAPPLLDPKVPITKRQVLTEIARLFDPAGWLSPIVLVAKMFMQDLWRQGFDWDVSLPKKKSQQWQEFRSSLRDTTTIQLPRWLQWAPSSQVQLHAFSDASGRAIAAVVYLRAETSLNTACVTLVVAKTKLTPVRSLNSASRPLGRITIPRLELRAALLAARLLRFASCSLGIPLQDCHAWSDSSVVLHWLRSERSVDNDLVDSYVCQIHEVMPYCQWRHVRSADNPADIATRGSNPAQLGLSRLWWSGPTWLLDPLSAWPHQSIQHQLDPLTTSRHVCAVAQTPTAEIIDHFSNLDRLLRALVRYRRLFRRRVDPLSPAVFDSIGPEHLESELLANIQRRQRHRYSLEIAALEKGQPLTTRSPLRALLPFLDEEGILRVGGRLGNSLLSFSEQHPAIIDRDCHLASLVIDWAHTRALHGGFRVTYTYAMRRVWIVGGRTAIKAHLRSCVVCARSSLRTRSQVMAHLPAARVVPSRPFSRCGVDYAGPFHVLGSKGRGIRSSKGYVAVFVCLCTKAIHLELVGDLSTASFLGALGRFSGRRGTPVEIWSDNATNFRGANAELLRMLKAATFCWTKVADSLSTKGIKWRFIPPSAPHFGGLWEAGVKSMKAHLRRVVGPRKLTYEEFASFLVEIETVLNSRPLLPVSGNIDDLDILTPAHFLLGTRLTSHPRPIDARPDVDHATHWRLVEGLRDRFWIRWSREYLNTLQQRWKWSSPQIDLAAGDIVMVIDPSLLRGQGRWPLGRVLEVFPGSDRHVRVVKIKTEDGEYLRPITKIVRLPVSTLDTPSNSDSATTIAGGSSPSR